MTHSLQKQQVRKRDEQAAQAKKPKSIRWEQNAKSLHHKVLPYLFQCPDA